ncbi:hypothetical protein CDAR_118171 [Caerostris darwini]|uniref:Uncharacterized protein n=1 Tax=Caerostris darwini TaxID=1538125 RepID=A0AAV4TL45_9ARAC|nr:hypothetical protein CDAR_118171 [Caerostris darwini]
MHTTFFRLKLKANAHISPSAATFARCKCALFIKSVRLLAGFFKNSAGGVSETNEPPMAETNRLSREEFSRRRLFQPAARDYGTVFIFEHSWGSNYLLEGKSLKGRSAFIWWKGLG